MSTPVFKIRNDLIEAYKGIFEDRMEYPDDNAVHMHILNSTPLERLEVYCEWNGIIGYASSLYDIATGKLS